MKEINLLDTVSSEIQNVSNAKFQARKMKQSYFPIIKTKITTLQSVGFNLL